jgi:hypothetical protein
MPFMRQADLFAGLYDAKSGSDCQPSRAVRIKGPRRRFRASQSSAQVDDWHIHIIQFGGAMLETCGWPGGVYLPGDRVEVLKQ